MHEHIRDTKEALCNIEEDVHHLRKMENKEEDNMGENFDSGMLAGLLSKQGIDPGIVAMLNDRRDRGDWGGDGGMLVLLFLVLLLGGGNGFWGNRNNEAGIDKTIFAQSNYDTLMSAVKGNRDAVGQLAQTLNCDVGQINSALCGVDKQLAINNGDMKAAVSACCCNIRTELLQSQNAIQSQMASGFCDVGRSIERQGCQTRADIQDTRFLIQATQSAQDNLIQAQFASQNAYLAQEFNSIKQREDAREIQALRDRLAEQRDSANTLAILNAIKGKDAIAFQGTAGATAFTGTGTLN